MAEIKIEKRKPMWPWLLLSLGLAAALIYFITFRDKNDEKKEIIELISVSEKNTTVDDYVNFIESDSNKMSLDHAFTNDALLRLTDATDAMADEIDVELQTDLDKVDEYAEMITKDPLDTSHANSIRKATDILTNALHEIQKANYSGLKNEVAELRAASESINPDVLTLNQQIEVKVFFQKAADLLKKMN
jgi:hypothetical protein